MLVSMTGFGKSSVTLESLQIDVEIKSVNHRFLDIHCKLPSSATAVEPLIVALLRKHLQRGRIELYVVRKGSQPQVGEFKVQKNMVAAIAREMRVLAAEGISAPVIDAVCADLLSRREVIEYTCEEQLLPEESSQLLSAVQEALDALVVMREEEGAAIQIEVEQLLGAFCAQVATIRESASSVSKTLEKRLKERLSQLLDDKELDPERLYQEVAYLADKADITEELARIESHVQQFKETLSDGTVGRKLEFLLQELGREVNTCGSKSQEVKISRAVVEAKAVLEKLREQVANVE